MGYAGSGYGGHYSNESPEQTVKKLMLVVVAATVACHGRGAAPNGMTTGASSAEGAVNAYIAASKARDLQALSAVWGTSKGSVRETLDRAEFESRGTIVMALICPDEHRITNQLTGQGGRRTLRVQFQRGGRTIDVSFVTVPGPADRWYVEDIPMRGDLPQQLQSFCR
jgi:hypothetical protein